jgi:hypothetical protein
VTSLEQQSKRVRLARRADRQLCVQADRQMIHEPIGKQLGIDMGPNACYIGSDGKTIDVS